MTVYYVDSAAGSNTSPYNSWATAATALGTIAGIDAAGDTIYVASTHNETSASALSYSWSGTLASPVRIICADKTSGAPPTTAATGGTISTTGASTITPCSAGVVTFYGINFSAGSGSSLASIACSGTPFFDTCGFTLGATNTASHISIVNALSTASEFRNCTFSFGAAAQSLNYAAAGGYCRVVGGSIKGGSSAITALLAVTSGVGNIDFIGFDASNGAAAMNLVSSASNALEVNFIQCKLPTSWTGSVNGNSSPGGRSRVSAYQCDNAGTSYVLSIADASGTIVDETTIVLSGGATDGTTPVSWHLASNTQASWPGIPLRSDWRAVWVDTTTSKTLTWQYIADTNVAAGQGAGTGNAFQNNQVWIEAMYFGSSTSPLGTFASSAPSTPLTSATDNASGSGTWTTTGLTTPKQGECTLTFTTAMKGPMLARICVGAASKTIYADPDPTFA